MNINAVRLCFSRGVYKLCCGMCKIFIVDVASHVLFEYTHMLIQLSLIVRLPPVSFDKFEHLIKV